MSLDHLLLDTGDSIEYTRSLFRFYNYIKSLLLHADVDLMVAASKTFGRIVKIGGARFGQYSMDYEVRAAIQLLHPMQETSRYAGVLILKELAQNYPTCFHSHVDLVFDNILYPLRDTLLTIREEAAELLAACLEMVIHQERELHPNPRLIQILNDAQTGLEQPHPEIIHGSLLTYGDLLLHGGMVSTNGERSHLCVTYSYTHINLQFIKNNSFGIADQILRLESHSDPLVRQIVAALIPIIATYDTQSL